MPKDYLGRQSWRIGWPVAAGRVAAAAFG